MVNSHLALTEGTSPFSQSSSNFLAYKEIQRQLRQKTAEFSNAIKRQAAKNASGGATDEIRILADEASALRERSAEIVRAIQSDFGRTDEQLDALEELEMPELEDRYWRKDVEMTAPTVYLDNIGPEAISKLRATVDPEWLKDQSHKQYRLGAPFRTQPLSLVSGIPVNLPRDTGGPQRFAQMLLVSEDHFNKEESLNFFDAPTCVSESVALGTFLKHIPELGATAVKRFQSLPSMTDAEVTSTLFELFVGIACVRKGIDLDMLEPHKSKKTPDFSINSFGIPTAIECKRRLGLLDYEIQEGRRVTDFYSEIRSDLDELEKHVSIEVEFFIDVEPALAAQFRIDIRRLLMGSANTITETGWGKLLYRTLPYHNELKRTRLYSPLFMEMAFDWQQSQDQWDGIICEVDPPDRIAVTHYRNPRCMKWRSTGKNALLKKTRGITSLWADAAKQIPDGEMGFIYIGYPETSRPELADARTKHIIETCDEWYARWSVNIPYTFINRLYPRALGNGEPDLIESVMILKASTSENLLGILPTQVITF